VLIEACLRPGVPVAQMEQEHCVNANLLRKWITRYMQKREEKRVDEATVPSSPAAVVIDLSSAFVPVAQASAAIAVSPLRPLPSASMTIALHVSLPSGAKFDLGEAKLEELSTVVETLERLPRSDSTRG
jgi:transposase